MEPVQKNCHISIQRFESWIHQALAGQLEIEVSKKPDKAIIYKGSYFLNDVKQDLPTFRIKEIFWGLMHKHGRIRVDGHLYLVKNAKQELWNKYTL